MKEERGWNKVYAFVLLWNALLILVFYIITKIFNH